MIQFFGYIHLNADWWIVSLLLSDPKSMFEDLFLATRLATWGLEAILAEA